MTQSSTDFCRFHEDIPLFREAVLFTARKSGFSTTLVEKDYYCSLLLSHLCIDSLTPLVFKGGTCLSKVYADFYRLSEDLDFVISMKSDSTRSQRSKAAKPLGHLVDSIPKLFPGMRIEQPLRGHNNSKQYISFVEYSSVVAEQVQHIKIEISLREGVERPVDKGNIRTLLQDAIKKTTVFPEFDIPVMAFEEAYAEKTRAALTRRKPAIRDFYDIFHAVKTLKLDVFEEQFLKLVGKKLKVPGNDPVDVSPRRKELLKSQTGVELRTVLRESDYESFNLDEAFEIAIAVAGRLGKAHRSTSCSPMKRRLVSS